MRDAFLHAHENDEDPPERPVPKLRIDKQRSLDALIGFIDLQLLSNKGESAVVFDPPPFLCTVVSALEAAGSLPAQNRVLPEKLANLGSMLRTWSESKSVDESSKGPTKSFMNVYAGFAEKFPKDFGKREV